MLHRTAVTSSRGIDVRIENKVVFRLTMTRGGGGGDRGSVFDVGALQGDGRTGVRLSVGSEFLIFKHVHTPSGAHQASTATATGVFPSCKAAGTCQPHTSI